MCLAMQSSMKTRAILAVVATSASLNLVFWKAKTGLPKACRSFVYFSVWARDSSIAVTAATARTRRSCGNCCINWMKPCPSSTPSRFVAGTRTPSKNSSAVSCPCWPIFFSTRPRLKPSSPSVSTTISEMPLAAFSGSVLATMTTRLACRPLEMKVFEPSMTYSSPVRIALVLMLCRSDPVPGSVIATAPTNSPLAIPGSQRCFCSSVP